MWKPLMKLLVGYFCLSCCVATAQRNQDSGRRPERSPGRGGGLTTRLAGHLLAHGDNNQDAKLTQAELTTLATSWYKQFDTKETGKLTQDEFSVGLETPDGQSLYIVCGNQTNIFDTDTSRVPLHWSEDHLLPRLETRFMAGVLGPAGFIARTDPEGKNWELIATGFRNEFDVAFNREGELFTFDADMEWDIGDPWYRPTRVNHVISGAEFGWRNGAGKWPDYYFDSFGAVVNVGPGSPTGVAFGYGAKFPAE